jgi:hypothetical protein
LWHRHAEGGNVLAFAKFLPAEVTSSTRDQRGLADAMTSKQIFNVADVAGLLRRNRDATGTEPERSPFNRAGRIPLRPSFLPTDLQSMDQLSGYAHRPFHFVLRYLRFPHVADRCR